MELMQASAQWSSRPADERYLDLPSMYDHFATKRANSRAVVVPSKRLEAQPVADSNHKGLVLTGPNGRGYAPSHWAFGQLASLVGAPAGYLRSLPSEMAADCLNYGLQVTRADEEVGCLLYKNGGAPMLEAATGPKYGRIWNAEVVQGLMDRFGDGVTGHFRVPGEFGKQVAVNKSNTTLYAGDQDMFVFLADEERRITIPNRRDGQSGEMARGFFVWNSEVGARTFGIATFLFDYVCMNRIVWGATEYKQITVRHSSGAPDRFFREIKPALETYANSSTAGVQQAIEDARKASIADDLENFLRKRNFTSANIKAMVTAHTLEEDRPIETRWDAVVAATAVARSIEHQSDRVDLERRAGDLLK
jgi:hypothetical protein